MNLRFTKMHGLGNDFMVIDGISQSLPETGVPFAVDEIRRLGDRHFGVGFDQMLIVQPARAAGADFRYRILNADGSEVSQCGNGARCFARFVRDHGLTDKAEIVVETAAGQMTLAVTDDEQVTVDMGAPRWAPEAIPLSAKGEQDTYFLMADSNAYEVVPSAWAIRTAPCWWRMWTRHQSRPWDRCWKATSSSRSGSTWASCRSSAAMKSACASMNGAPGKPWPVAPAPAPPW